MLRVLRRTRLATLLALFVLTGAIPVSMAELFHGVDDVLCAPAPVLHDESAHRIGAAGTAATQPEHCAVCHWLQSLRTDNHSTDFVAPPADCDQLVASRVQIPATVALCDLSARAPPKA